MFSKLIKLSTLFVLLLAGYNTASASFTISRPPTNNLGLVGHWTFDGADVTDKVYDKSGQGNHGYFIGGATTTAKVKGKIGQALKFDGVDDYVSSGSSVNLNNGVTFSAWIKPSNYLESGFNMVTIGGLALGSNNYYLDM